MGRARKSLVRRELSMLSSRASVVSDGSKGLSHPPSSSSSIFINPRVAEGDRYTRWRRDHLGAWWNQTPFFMGLMQSCEISVTMLSRGRAANAASKTPMYLPVHVKENFRGAESMASRKVIGLGNTSVKVLQDLGMLDVSVEL